MGLEGWLSVWSICHTAWGLEFRAPQTMQMPSDLGSLPLISALEKWRQGTSLASLNKLVSPSFIFHRREWLRKTLNVSLWPPCAHVCPHTNAYVHVQHILRVVGYFLLYNREQATISLSYHPHNCLSIHCYSCEHCSLSLMAGYWKYDWGILPPASVRATVDATETKVCL